MPVVQQDFALMVFAMAPRLPTSRNCAGSSPARVAPLGQCARNCLRPDQREEDKKERDREREKKRERVREG